MLGEDRKSKQKIGERRAGARMRRCLKLRRGPGVERKIRTPRMCLTNTGLLMEDAKKTFAWSSWRSLRLGENLPFQNYTLGNCDTGNVSRGVERCCTRTPPSTTRQAPVM
jgi:hypothetical protein